MRRMVGKRVGKNEIRSLLVCIWILLLLIVVLLLLVVILLLVHWRIRVWGGVMIKLLHIEQVLFLRV